jgi:putative membrane protein
MVAAALSWVVVALHVAFALGEAVFWPKLARRFGLRGDAIEHTRALAQNQGAYNAGAAALLGWALLTAQSATAAALLVFVVAMSVVGALTVRWTIFVIQGVPALAALGARWLG